MIVTILQAPSGAGKSTWVNKYKIQSLAISPERIVTAISADDFFIHFGTYRFDINKLGEAHAACLRQFAHFVGTAPEMVDEVIVDNTNCSIAEIAPYIALGMAHGHEVRVFAFDVD